MLQGCAFNDDELSNDLVLTDRARMTEMFRNNSCSVGKWAEFQLEEIDFHLVVLHKHTLLDHMPLQRLLSDIVNSTQQNLDENNF